jgi:hypothetical protein
MPERLYFALCIRYLETHSKAKGRAALVTIAGSHSHAPRIGVPPPPSLGGDLSCRMTYWTTHPPRLLLVKRTERE